MMSIQPVALRIGVWVLGFVFGGFGVGIGAKMLIRLHDFLLCHLSPLLFIQLQSSKANHLVYSLSIYNSHL